MIQDHSESIGGLAAKAGPPVAVSGLTFLGVGLPELVQIVTLVYVCLMVVEKVYTMITKYIRHRKHEQSK